ncbi:MAG: TonB-dependent receptor [Lewinellaceae bacterium]|nr:TonB-dependent receptor [Lewinellaceae bacterium]
MRNIFLLLFTFSAFQLAAQQTVTGKVTDTEGEPLIGVNILVVGANVGGITDFDGNYSIDVPEEGKSLLFSYVGYAQREISINNRSVVNVELSSDAEALDEVVVIGYGTKKKRDVIGSVTTVKSESITKLKTTSFVDGLQGRASGVQVTSNSGVPGAPSTVKIRGVNSLSIGTDPLWIVDGMPIYSGSSLGATNGATSQDPMSMINPNDIESIQVLKDAAATAIYGSRGSNGVIIITTKTGKQGRGNISLDYSAGITELSRKPEEVGFTNTEEWFSLVETARRNSNSGQETPFDPNSILNLFRDDPIARLSREEALAVNTNWFGQILGQGNYQDLNLSGNMGFEKANMYLSFGYRNDNSVLTNNGLTRYSVRANLQFNPVNNLQVEARLNFNHTKNDRVKQQVGGALGNNSGGNSAGFGNANRNALPWYPIYNSDDPSGYWNPMSGNNLVAAIDRSLLVDEVSSYRGLGGLALEYSIPFVKGFSIRTEGSFDLIQANTLNWVTATLRENGSFASDESRLRRSINYNLYAKYNREFGRHALSITAGTESQEDNQELRLMEGQNLTGTYKEIGNPQDLLTLSGGLNYEEYLRAFFGRADYKFKDRYFLGVSFRRDGSSKFNEDYRWGFFPALSLGWVVSDEPFWGDNFLSSVKLRGSYGQTGNKNIPSNRFVTTYANNPDWRYGPSEVIQEGTRITNIGVPTLTWETTSSYDFGIDYGLWDGRVSGSVAYYFQDVTDLLLSSPLATSAGLEGNRIWGNIGDMQNWGLEVELSSVNVRRSNFSWRTDFNITTNKNKVVRLTSDLDRSGRGLINGNQMSRTGGRLWTYYMAEDAGVDPERGVNMIWEIDIDHFEATGETVKTGRRIPATLNNLQNHRIIHQDKTSVPTVFGGFNNTFTYKGFDLSVFFSFSAGDYLYDYEEQRTTDVQYGQVVLRKSLIGNTWTPDNPNARYPELRWQGAYPWSWDPEVENPESPTGKGDWVEASGNYKNETVNWTKYLYKADFIRLRNLQAGYTFPKQLVQRWKIQNLRVYVTGTNLWVYSPHYDGWDPESGGGVLPPLEIWSGGLSVTF